MPARHMELCGMTWFSEYYCFDLIFVAQMRWLDLLDFTRKGKFGLHTRARLDFELALL